LANQRPEFERKKLEKHQYMFNSLEIEFIGIGKGSTRSGDAIIIRYGNCENDQWVESHVALIDGGDVQTGKLIVQQIKDVYNKSKIDLCVLTHPDADHASGLREVLSELDVNYLWMHRPWHYWEDIKDSIQDGRITKKSFNERLKEEYQFAYELEQIALERKIRIEQPHQGNYMYHQDENDRITILGPGKEFYKSLIQASDKTPRMTSSLAAMSILEHEEGLKFESMDFSTEHLSEENEITSAENDMSLVLLVTIAGFRILLTADVVTMGMYKVLAFCIQNSIDLKNLTLLQVPHHGSRHNISKGILQHMHAPSAAISCAENGAPNHPASVVTNALLRRQIIPYATKGNTLLWTFGNAPSRPGFYPVPALSFESWVDV